MKRINRHFDVQPHEKEKGGGGTITEQVYVTTNQQIQNMLRAGATLKAWRQQNINEVTEPMVNPMAKKSFTEFDAAELAQATTAKLRAQLKARDDAKKADAERAKNISEKVEKQIDKTTG